MLTWGRLGLTGMIIVDDGSDAQLGLPRTFGVDDLPLILQDRTFDSDGSIEYDSKTLDALDIAYGARGDTVIVNGAVTPVAKVPPGVVRLRLLNAANAQNFELRFSDQRIFQVIASDGGFLSAPVAVKQLIISPAERFEILVDFADEKTVLLETGPDKEMGVFGRVAPDASADYVPVMRFEPKATSPFVKELPTRLIDLPSVSRDSAVRRQQFVLNSGLCARRDVSAHAEMASLIGINGRPFDMKRIDIETKLGTSEVWEITSIGMAHPFEDKAELLVAFNQRATRSHPFMYHCHILEHEDAGLMGQYVCA
jgi:blue copper oxidase